MRYRVLGVETILRKLRRQITQGQQYLRVHSLKSGLKELLERLKYEKGNPDLRSDVPRMGGYSDRDRKLAVTGIFRLHLCRNLFCFVASILL